MALPIVVVSTFPSCGRLTFPQHLEIVPHIWWFLAVCYSSISSAPWHSRCSQRESASLLAVSYWLSACCPHPAQEGRGREKGSAETNPVAASPGGSEHARAVAPRSVLAQRSVLQDAPCAASAFKGQHGSEPLALWSGLSRLFCVAFGVSARAM